jgi:uncharacterized protein YihD (DUF1040 family)
MSSKIKPEELEVLEFIYKQESEAVHENELNDKFDDQLVKKLYELDLLSTEFDSQQVCLTDKAYEVNFELKEKVSLFDKAPQAPDYFLFSYFQGKFGMKGWLVVWFGILAFAGLISLLIALT